MAWQTVGRKGLWRAAALVVAVAMTALPTLETAKPVERKWGTAEAAAKLDEMQEELARHEELVERLRNQLPSAQGEQTCHVSDQECRRQEKRARRRKARSSDPESEEPPSERFKYSKSLELPKVKVTVTKWLPFPDANEPQKMSRMLVSGDVKGSLHLFSSEGNLIVSHPTGMSASISAIAVHKVHESECIVVAASEKGGIRSFAVSRPPRYLLSLEERKNKRKGPMAWLPLIRQIANFAPSSAAALEGVQERHFRVDMAAGGPKAIAFVEVIPKGKSYNVLVGDVTGRVSMHLRNGTAIGALRLAEESDKEVVLAAAVGKSWTALGTESGVLLYDNKWRRLHNTTCMGLPVPPDPAAQPPAEEEDDAGKQPGRRAKRPEPVPLTTRVESVHVEPAATHTLLYAGTNDGRALVLQVRGGERGRLQCTVLHDLSVLEEEAGGRAAVSVAGVRGFLVAGASSKTVTALNIFNATGTTRARRPSLFHYLPLEVAGADTLQLATDGRAGLAVGFGKQAVMLYQVRLPWKEPSEDSLEWLNLVRHPMVLGAMVLFFVWRMRSGKKGSKKDLDFAQGRNKDVGSLGGLLGKGRGGAGLGGGFEDALGGGSLKRPGSRVQWEDEAGGGRGYGGGRGGGGMAGRGRAPRVDEEEEYDDAPYAQHMRHRGGGAVDDDAWDD